MSDKIFKGWGCDVAKESKATAHARFKAQIISVLVAVSAPKITAISQSSLLATRWLNTSRFEKSLFGFFLVVYIIKSV